MASSHTALPIVKNIVENGSFFFYVAISSLFCFLFHIFFFFCFSTFYTLIYKVCNLLPFFIYFHPYVHPSHLSKKYLLSILEYIACEKNFLFYLLAVYCFHIQWIHYQIVMLHLVVYT